MTTLNQLSAEALARITELRIGAAVIQLWLCGDALLNRKLQRDGCSRLVLKDCRILSAADALPVMTYQFCGLRKLVVETTDAHLQNIQFLCLPSTLTNLTLRLPNVVEVVNDLNVCMCFPGLRHLKLAQTFSGKGAPDPVTWHMLNMRPVTGKEPSLRSDIFFTLPNTLETLFVDGCLLDVNTKRLQECRTVVAALPRSLCKLRLNIAYPTLKACVDVLPPTLTSVLFNLIPHDATHTVMLENMPLQSGLSQTLTALNLLWNTYDDARFRIAWRTLPRSLTQLRIGEIDRDDVYSSAQKLSLDEWRAHLPPGLTRLSMAMMPLDWSTVTDVDVAQNRVWPASLTDVHWFAMHDLKSHDHFLNHLHFPSRLRKLAITGMPVVLGQLPTQHLASLEVVSARTDFSRFTALTSLVHYASVTTSFDYRFPPSLKRYIKGNVLGVMDFSDAVRALPATLESFEMDDNIQGLASYDVFALLPRAITDLNLTLERELGGLNELIRSLPPCLRKLRLFFRNKTGGDLPTIESILGHCNHIRLSALPPTLELLHVRGHVFALPALDCIMPRITKLRLLTVFDYTPQDMLWHRCFPNVEKADVTHSPWEQERFVLFTRRGGVIETDAHAQDEQIARLQANDDAECLL